MVRIPFYEYIDLVDPTNKLQELERRGKRENKYSWKILIDEIKENVIINENIEIFINRVNENVKFSNIYYNSINIYIDKIMEIKNEENSKYLFELQKYILLDSLVDEKFYNLQKKKLYQEMIIISKIYYKLKTNDPNTEDYKIKEFIKGKKDIFEKRKKLIILINKKKLISNEDNLIMNIKNEEDIIIALDFIHNNEKVYNNVKLPNFIKIREYNNYCPIISNYENNIKNIKIINNKYSFYVNNNSYNSRSRTLGFKCNNYIYIIYLNINKTCLCFILILIINIYDFLHYFDLWRKKHKTNLLRWEFVPL